MTYSRVIPRDLFNDANLLKCVGRLYLELETLNLPGVCVSDEDDGCPFAIYQDHNDGSTYIDNVRLEVNGERLYLYRPMNSRQPWPLYVVTADCEDIQVFDDSGNLATEFLAFIQSESVR